MEIEGGSAFTFDVVLVRDLSRETGLDARPLLLSLGLGAGRAPTMGSVALL